MSAHQHEALVKFVTEPTATAVEGNGSLSPHAELHVLRLEAGVVVVTVYGEHDLSTKSTVLDLFMSLVEQNSLLVVDLTKATFIDSTFLNCLVQAHRRAQECGSRLQIRLNNSSPAHGVFEITGLLDYLDTETDDHDPIKR